MVTLVPGGPSLGEIPVTTGVDMSNLHTVPETFFKSKANWYKNNVTFLKIFSTFICKLC